MGSPYNENFEDSRFQNKKNPYEGIQITDPTQDPDLHSLGRSGGKGRRGAQDDKIVSSREIDGKDKRYTIKPYNKRFPLCIVWTPLPLITWLLPCIGHTGIGDTKGILHDFAGPYYVSVDDLAFGETHKYVVLKLDGVTEE